jgi:hypothetical protein
MFNFHYRQEIPALFNDNIYGGYDIYITPLCAGGSCIRHHHTPSYTNIPMHRNAYRSMFYENEGRKYANICQHTPAYFIISQCSLAYLWRFIILCVFCALILRNM